jgi:hypothetical protein
MTRVEVLALLGSSGLFVMILELVRRKRLKEKYSLLWLLTAFALFALSLFKGLLVKLSYSLGIYYPPSAFFLLAFMFLMLITVQFSVVISRLSERNKILGQEVALLKQRLDELEKAGKQGSQ